MSLTDSEQRLIHLFVAIVAGDWDRVRELRLACTGAEPDRGWRETVLQAHVFAGFPRVVEALGVLQAAGGLGTPDPDEMGPGDTEAEARRGRALFERIYESKGEAILTTLEAGHADFADWILGHAYGRVLARPGLTARMRELLAVAALASQGQLRQLASHARGAVRCGATPEEVIQAVELLGDRLDAVALESAREVAARFSARA